MRVTHRLEGLAQTVANLGDMPKATRRNVLRRVLKMAGEPIAAMAAQRAPHGTGKLAFSIAVSPTLTRRQRRGGRLNEVEMHIGPAGGAGSLQYASFQEFGSIHNVASGFMRGTWDSLQAPTLSLIASQLGREVEAAAQRAARKVARLAA